MKRWLLLFVLACPCMVTAQQFRYPVPPDSIRGRQERVEYMVCHFWNEQSISDTANFQSPKLLLDYLYLLKQENQEKQESHARAFVTLSCKAGPSFGRILFWLDQILYDSSSPQYDEELYMKLMTAVVASAADSAMKLVPTERVRMMSQNQMGKLANNFFYVDKKGERHELYDVDAPLLLLVFNNPDCPLCHQAEKALCENTLLRDMQKEGQLKVLAITPDADMREWKSHNYPSSWLVGFDRDGVIYGNRLYDIQRFPCMYLLDGEKRVLLKEAGYEGVSDFLERLPCPDRQDN